MSFEDELSDLINKHSLESENNTPDFILAEYIRLCLNAYSHTVNGRDAWYEDQDYPKHESME